MRVQDMIMELEIPEDHEDHDMEEPQEPLETLHEKDSHKRKPTWERELIQYVERYGAPEGCIEKGKDQNLTTAMWPCCVTSLTRNLPPMKRLHKRKNGRMP